MERKNGIPGFENEPEHKQILELRRMYWNVFSSEEGKIVLTSILEDLHFFSPCLSDAENALNNYAKHLVNNRLGISSSYDKTINLLKDGFKE